MNSAPWAAKRLRKSRYSAAFSWVERAMRKVFFSNSTMRMIFTMECSDSSVASAVWLSCQCCMASRKSVMYWSSTALVTSSLFWK